MGEVRHLRAGAGSERWESWDRLGVLRPIAFSTTGPYLRTRYRPAGDSEGLVFREEVEYRSWDEYAWDADGYPEVSDLFSPWQVLCLAGALDDAFPVPTAVLVKEPDQIGSWTAQVSEWAAGLRARWQQLDDWWRPLVKVLVRLQNRYWPEVWGRVNLITTPDGTFLDPHREEVRTFDAPAVLEELGLRLDQVADNYAWLAEQGQELESGDGWFLLRQMAPRAARRNLRGPARRAQDFYDAAAILRRFYFDLTGETLEDAEITAAARRYGNEVIAERRAALLGHGPTLGFDAEDLKRGLVANGLYPHSVHVIFEGESERRLVQGVVARLLGRSYVEDLVMTDLEGIGSARRIETLVSAVADYALAAVLFVDDEGGMRAETDRLIADGALDQEDVLLASTSLEEDNFTDDELVEMAAALAADPPDAERAPVTLSFSGEELRAYHDDRIQRSSRGDKPGLADSLQKLARARDDAPFSKPELADAILARLLDELPAEGGREAILSAADQRPVLSHIVRRVVERLAEAPLDRPRPRRARLAHATAEGAGSSRGAI